MQLDGITIKSMDELRENPSSELLQMYKDGRLGRWLGSHHADEERDKLNNLTLTGDSVKDLAAIFEILGIDRDSDDIRSSLFAETGYLGNSKSAEEVSNRLNLAYFLQALFWIKNKLPRNINFIDRDYISLKITTKEYLNRIHVNKKINNDALDNTFFFVKEIKTKNKISNEYINKVIRCIFGTVNDIKSGEKHIDSPSWQDVKDKNSGVWGPTTFFSIYGGNCYNDIKVDSLWLNDIHFPLRRTFDPVAVLIVLKKICHFCGDVKISFSKKGASGLCAGRSHVSEDMISKKNN